MNPLDPLFLILMAVVAAVYSSVGHGGASGYRTLMVFSALTMVDASVLALVANVFVAGISFLAFQKAKHFDWSLAWPFLIGSVPMAFLGGSLRVSERVYTVLLVLALTGAAIRLLWTERKVEDSRKKLPHAFVGVFIGALIGVVSGMVGVGGGVFLSPILVLAGWADAKRTSAVAALFIVANSIAGLLARPWEAVAGVVNFWPLVAAAVGGATVGSMLGANIVPAPWIRRTLGGVLLVAVAKLALGH